MHSYLRAIGFSSIKSRNQLESVYRSTLSSPNRKIVTTVSVNTSLIQFEKDFGEHIGIALIGEYDINGNLSIEHYFPYVKGISYECYDYISIEKQTDKESYAGVCEDIRLGMTLIFYVLNIADYAKSKWLNYSNRTFNDVKLSALSTGGTVLLGTASANYSLQKNNSYKSYTSSLIDAAKNGDNDAIEKLNLFDLDMYSSINQRVKKEDLLSIINTSIMPCGVECDHYMIIGNIFEVKEVINSMTNEKIYVLSLEVNDIILNVAINQADLQGEPAAGRRFRGEVWLQGYVHI